MPTASDGMPWGFRHKAAFVFGEAGGRLILGHYAAGSRRIVPVEVCPVHDERANALAFRLRDALAGAGLRPAGPRLAGLLRHVVIRAARGSREAVMMLVVTRNDRALRGPLRAFLRQPDPPGGFLLNMHDRPGPYMVGDKTLHLSGRPQILERIAGAVFLVSPHAFFQTNADGAEALVALVLERAGAAPMSVLDLYAGAGLFAIPLAARGHRVTAVEEDRNAASDAARNGRVNRLSPDRLRFIRARVEDALPQIRERPDLAILDPPRAGCSPAVIRDLFGRLAPPSVLYVSCNPAALAAELPAMLGAGYRIERIQPVDMFPHTEHVEVAATIVRE
jgi:23S rRNA (uracil1939-C5)-methyltransferase